LRVTSRGLGDVYKRQAEAPESKRQRKRTNHFITEASD
jgi:hypothetical protein